MAKVWNGCLVGLLVAQVVACHRLSMLEGRSVAPGFDEGDLDIHLRCHMTRLKSAMNQLQFWSLAM